MVMNKNKNSTQQRVRFSENCRFLELKLLPEKYQQWVDKAGKETPGYFEFIDEIIQAEAAEKMKRRVQYLIRISRLPQPLKMLSDFDFDFQPKLDRRLIMDLTSLQFIERSESILFIGQTNGVGKSHIARSLALLACQQGYKTYYTTLGDMIKDLNTGVFEKTLDKRMRKYFNPELLLIDEMGHDRLELELVKEAHRIRTTNPSFLEPA